MTFFSRASLSSVLLLGIGACNNPADDLTPHDMGARDMPITFEAGPPLDAGPTDSAVDAPFDAFCGTVGCVTAGACAPMGAVTTLDTSTMHTAAGVGAAVDGTGYLATFDGFRSDGTNVVTRPIAHDGTPGTEQVVTSTFLFARHPSVAYGTGGGLAVYETNDPPPTQVDAIPLAASGSAMGSATPLTSGTGMTPHGPVVAPFDATSLVAVWLAAPETSPGVPGPAHAVVARLSLAGHLVGSAATVTSADPGGVVTASLATGDTSPALLTVEQDSGDLDAVRVRPIATDGTPASAAVDVVTGRTVSGGVTGARIGTGTLVAWGENVSGAREEVHIAFVDDGGAVMPEHIVTLGTETGTNPQLARVSAGTVLAYRGGPPGSRGVRAVGVNAYGTLAATATTIFDGGEDPAMLSVAAIDASSVLFVLADLSPDGSGSRVRAATANCTGM